MQGANNNLLAYFPNKTNKVANLNERATNERTNKRTNNERTTNNKRTNDKDLTLFNLTNQNNGCIFAT